MNYFKSRRGVSQVVSALMLIVITMAAFGYVWNYANAFLNAQRSEFFPTLRERFVVEDVWFHHNGTITLSLLNVGMAPLKIVEVHVNNVNAVLNPASLFLGRFEEGVVIVHFGGWVSNQAYSILIITDGGYIVEATATAP